MINTDQFHALLCWEYGAGLGHIAALKTVAKRLKRLGWRTTLVNPTGTSLAPDKCFDEILTLPAANQLVPDLIADPDAPIASFNHAVRNFGYSSAKYVFTRLQLWSALFAKTNPDLVIADYAPSALLAARGVVPSIAIGNGYTLPPVNIKHYPRFFDIEDVFDSAQLLTSVNSALRLSGKSELDFLPEIFLGDFQACRTFDITDPFQKIRDQKAIGPLLSKIIKKAPAKPPRRIFVYLSHCNAHVLEQVTGVVAKIGISADIYALQKEQLTEQLDGVGIVRLLLNPIPLDKIISDYSLVIHLGGHSLSMALLIAGVPQLLLPTDIEKVLLGIRLKKAELAEVHRIDVEVNRDKLDATIKAAFHDSSLKNRVGKFVEQYPAQLHLKPLNKLIDACVRLVS